MAASRRTTPISRPLVSPTSTPASRFGAGIVGQIGDQNDWFPVRIASVISGDPDGYTFVEVRIGAEGEREDCPNGRQNSEDDPAYPIDGRTYEVGDLALCRRGIGAELWELAPVANPSEAGCGPGCGWVAGLNPTHCLRGAILSESADCDADEAWDPVLRWDEGTFTWIAEDWLTLGGYEWEVAFLRDRETQDGGGDPELWLTEIVGGGPGGVRYKATLDCCGEDYAIFAVGWPACTAPPECPQQSPSLLITRIKVSWEPCPHTGGWEGAGWYCVTYEVEPDCEDGAQIACEYLETDPGICTNEGELAPVTICAGPWATENECRAYCVDGGSPPVSPPACQLTNFATAGITLTVSNKTGDCTCLPDLPALGSSGIDSALWTTNTCPGNVDYTLACTGGVYAFTAPGVTVELVSAQLSPFVLVYDLTFPGGILGGAGGTARFTITSP